MDAQHECVGIRVRPRHEQAGPARRIDIYKASAADPSPTPRPLPPPTCRSCRPRPLQQPAAPLHIHNKTPHLTPPTCRSCSPRPPQQQDPPTHTLKNKHPTLTPSHMRVLRTEAATATSAPPPPQKKKKWKPESRHTKYKQTQIPRARLPCHGAGDLGRSRPSLGDLLGGCRAQIVSLDVEQVHMEFGPESQ